VLVDRDYIKANASRDYDNHVRIPGAKLTIDGSPQGFTALRDRPYYDPVGNYPPAMPAMRPRQTNRSSTRLTGRLPTIFKL